ncbi:MAG: HAD family phosphatase [Clostridiales bacterium]|jgi:HAD superfamily hydrolase (TIGR01484 family)|nr:HAD family phosphatase [Clostridiales bacterium]
MSDLKLIALDLDGTLTQHKSRLEDENRAVLDKLSKKYKLLMVGAGQCMRIFNQMNKYPVDIIGNYGMQYGIYNPGTGDLEIVRDVSVPCNREETEEKVWYIRRKFNFMNFTGDNVEYHKSGCITIPLLGTKANLEDKLNFDPTREKRRKIYNEVKAIFGGYNVFVGGSSSFDLAPLPYDKYYALDLYCREKGFDHSEVLYVGDDYGLGGNDEAVYRSDFKFICIDDYRDFGLLMREYI